MKQKVGYIYTHTNMVNGKVYVGKTVQLPERRFGKNYMRKYKSCTAFLRALKKYGQENFKTEVILTVLDTSYLNHFEAEFIKFYNSVTPHGYNLVTYDNGLVKYSDESKKRISDSRKIFLSNLTTPLIAPNKKEHIKIDGILHKECSKCKELKTLGNFCKNKRRWDKLNAYCSPCAVKYKKAYDPKPLSKEEWEASYVNRKQALSKGQKERFSNPKEVEKFRQLKSQPVIAICEKTQKQINYTSGLAAHAQGFNRTGVSRACKSGKPYKGYIWKKADSTD